MRTDLAMSRRSRTACSVLAMATALVMGPSPAAAQSFQGTGTPLVPGSATITTPTGTTTQINVNNAQTVIDWSTFDQTGTAPIAFQAGGTTANFVMGGANYAVLNRIISNDPSRQIQMFGNINSTVGSTTGPVGGSVYFYSPGGFLFGATSAINVGSLVVSASPIQFDANGTFITGARNEVVFGQALTPGATITTNTGAQFNANNEGSYVALVAPRVIRGGNIAVNGQAAIVAAEAATIRFAPDGLFDIEVTSGTGQANGITGGGDITGPASSGAGDNHRVYMVAVPKNQAMSLAISQGADLGFAVAQAADVVGNAIVLSAGHDIVGGAIQTARSAGGGTGASTISANAINATSAVTARATESATFFSNAGQASNFASNLTVTAPVQAWASASGSDASLNVAGNVTLNSDVSAAPGASATGGWASFYAQNGGSVTVGGSVFLSADGYGGSTTADGVAGGSGTGGRAWIQAEPGSTMSITGAATASANGYGGNATGLGAAGGSGTGGQAWIRAFGVGSTLGIDGDAYAAASGFGGDASNGNGGLGTGGAEAAIYADTGSLTLDGSATAEAYGQGGSGGGAGNSSGDGSGGTSFIYAAGGGTLLVAGDARSEANGRGGIDFDNVAASGDGTGGTAYLYSNASTATIGGFARAVANGDGGNGGECLSCGGAAGIGRGGSAFVSSTGAGSILDLTTITVQADGTGSVGTIGVGGDGLGGWAELFAQTGGAVDISGDLTLSATGRGGYDFGGFGGGDGFGGGYAGGSNRAQVRALSGGTINVTGNAQIEAVGLGGSSQEQAGSTGGDGIGGRAFLATSGAGSAITLNTVTVLALGAGGDTLAGIGGTGTGGDNATIDAVTGTILITGSATVAAEGAGGNGATGGAADGGGDPLGSGVGARIVASENGQVTINGQAIVSTRALGGTGTSGGGSAVGGRSYLFALTGGDIDILGLTRVTSDATAGAGAVGRGGLSFVNAFGAGSTVDLNTLNLRADGYGGNGSATLDAGDGYGGTASMEANGAGASITLAASITTGGLQNSETLSADGFGGSTFGFGDATGGTGFGGTMNLRSIAGGNVSLNPTAGAGNPLYARARGYGGSPEVNGATGGLGDGGIINLVVDGGTMTLGQLQLSSIGQGGTTNAAGLNTNGGNAVGGERHISVLNGGTLNAAIPGGVSGGVGGEGTGTGDGGNGTGGISTLTINASTANFTGNTIVLTQAFGGRAAGSGTGGDGSGGVTTVNITNGSTVTIANGSSLSFSATSFGGGSLGGGAGGGASAGSVNATITDSTITGGTLIVQAQAIGGSGATGGGNAVAGNAALFFNGSNFNGEGLTVTANAAGGSANSGTAGNATAGTARLIRFAGNSNITLSSGLLQILAVGTGGAINGGSSGSLGGTGSGGTAFIASANAGQLTVNGNTLIDGRGIGGSIIEGAGAGGNAFGGSAQVFGNGGDVLFNGNLSEDGSATGGDGEVGGNAEARISPQTNETLPIAATLFAETGGSITVTGAMSMNIGATGGSGYDGNGGNAIAGEADVAAFVGDITLGTLAINGLATGGSGGNGGNGGNARGGIADITFGLDGNPVGGTLDFGSITVSVNALGGAGGQGAGANTGGNGGNGGEARAGGIVLAGSAAGGFLDTGAAQLTATALGGAGGAGGNGDSGAGGNGGNGGVAFGGNIQTGTISNAGVATSGGGATFTTLSINSSAAGGSGGAGGTGGGGNGNGGNGGGASGGVGTFLARGVLVTADGVTLAANAQGGNGGIGAVAGAGGNATSGMIQVESKDRFGFATQRGSLIANTITGTATATGGAGAITGAVSSLGGSYFRVLNGDSTIGTFSFTITGGLPSATADFVSAIDGNAAFTGDFAFNTTNNLILFADNGTLTAGILALSANDFVPDTVNEPTTTPGTFFADTFDITTNNDFYTVANLDSRNLLDITAPGSISTGNIRGDQAVYLNAQGSFINVGNVNSVDEIRLNAIGDITTGSLTSSDFYILAAAGGALTVGPVDASDFVYLEGQDGVSYASIIAGDSAQLYSNGLIQGGNITAAGDINAYTSGSIGLGDLDSGNTIDLFAEGNIVIGDAIAAQLIEIATHYPGDVESPPIIGGSITTGNLTAGYNVEIDAGTFADLGDLSAGIVNPSTDPEADYVVAVLAGTNITTGNIQTANHAGLGAPGDITAGNVDVANIFMVLAGGSITLGSIDAGSNVYLADFSMMELGGSLGTDQDFDPDPILAATPVATGGDITIGGPVATAEFKAAAGGDFTSNNITSGGLLYIAAGGMLSTGNLSAFEITLVGGTGIGAGSVDGFSLEASSEEGDLLFGDLDLSSSLVLTSPGSITTGAIDTNGGVYLAAADSITTGDILFRSAVQIEAQGAVATGDIIQGQPILTEGIGTQDVGPGSPVEIFSDTAITTGDIVTDGYVGLYSGGSLATGSITAEHDVIALAGTDASFGAITTPERFILAGYDNFDALSGGETFDPGAIFDLDPVVSTGGDAAFGGSSSVGEFRAYVGGDTTVQSIAANAGDFGGYIGIDTGGLLSINGALTGDYVQLGSSDIAIGAAATIESTFGVSFHSFNPNGMFIGDNIAGSTGYRLSQAELDRVTTNSFGFETMVHRGGAALIVIGDLSLDLRSESEDEGAYFAVDDDNAEGPTGTIRVVGNAQFTVSPLQYVSFESETFELDAATGSLSLVDGAGALSGTLSLEATNIFVASEAILAKLRVNPQYAGFREELNAPAAVQRPEGVIRAAAVELGDDDAPIENLLVQNTGTKDTPAGFLVTDLIFGEGDEETAPPPPGSVNLVINGQIQTGAGTLTGIAVRDAMVDEFGTEIFVAGSTINGCELAGSCATVVDNLPPSVNTSPPIVAILGSDPLGEIAFGNEADIDDSVPGDLAEKSSPISPPQPLFDTSPLDFDGDVNDPVSGAGNPSLYGADEDEDDEEEDNGQPVGGQTGGVQ